MVKDRKALEQMAWEGRLESLSMEVKYLPRITDIADAT